MFLAIYNMNLCQSWNDVTVRQFIDLQNINPDQDDLELQLAIISVLSGKSVDELSNIPIQELKSNFRVGFVFELPRAELLPTNIKINGKHYRINYRIDKLKGGEYIDLKNYTKTNDVAIQNLHKILSLFIIPVKKKWFWKTDIAETIEQRNEKAQEILNHLSIAVAYPMSVFFWKLFRNSISGIQDYTLRQSENKIRNLLKSLKRSL